ncbi:MAG: calcium-translocating P-type ATPase, SERCA-type [Chloroflexi bacterium]|nr:calcium-translocating P-type ATPase, SERCA-type [Chloroflexota bacterium]
MDTAVKKKADWHSLEAAEVLADLHSSKSGLTREESERRLQEYGANELISKKKISPLAIFFEQFKDFLILILLAATVISLIIGETLDAIVIMVIVVFAAGVGFVQEFRAEKAIEALKKMAAPTARVLRGGGEEEIPAREVVPGDVVVLKAGDRIPADSRILEVFSLKVEEAALTGESVAVEKTASAIEGEMLPLGDRRDMVYMGTTAVYGRGMAVVTGTGMATEFGKISSMLDAVEDRATPLQQNLDKVGKALGVICLIVVAVVALVGLLRGHAMLEMLMWGISLAIAAVPEALPAVVTVSLAIGVQRMVKRNALVRQLPAVETLGCTTVICSDKTGTLTQDKMTVTRIYIDRGIVEVTGTGYEPKGEFFGPGGKLDPSRSEGLRRLLAAGILCNDSTLIQSDGRWRVKGDPTEGALVVLGEKAGLSHDGLNQDFPRIGEVPFSSERKRMTTIHRAPEGAIACCKGAPEVVLECCRQARLGDTVVELNAGERQGIIEAAQRMAGDGLRVLGIATRAMPRGSGNPDEVEKDMVFLGLVGMFDAPRPEAKAAIEVCNTAGIKTVMITGDHKLTAMAVARELGLLKGGLALSGAELDKMTDEEFAGAVEKVDVYARVSPAHKMRVIEAFARRGHIVAMTGDGVNDAPALKKSDIGVAMGITGTDVSKEASDVVLTDDNFASIVAAVEEGRGIFANIKKYLIYLLSCNIGEILIMFVAVLIGLPLPLVATQLLFVNLATDGLPALALSVDPPSREIMERPPRNPRRSIFTRPVNVFIGGVGIWTAAVGLGVFVWALGQGRSTLEAQGLTFVTLVLAEMFNAYNSRSEKLSVFKIGVFGNKWLNLSVLSSLAMTVIVVYLPALQDPFNTYALSVRDWLVAISAAATLFVAVELSKAVRFAKVFGRPVGARRTLKNPAHSRRGQGRDW